jgi:hypothetical protein
MWQTTLANAAQWLRRPEVAKWISRSRLDAIAAAGRGIDPADPLRRELNRLFRENAIHAAVKIPQLLASLDGSEDQVMELDEARS